MKRFTRFLREIKTELREPKGTDRGGQFTAHMRPVHVSKAELQAFREKQIRNRLNPIDPDETQAEHEKRIERAMDRSYPVPGNHIMPLPDRIKFLDLFHGTTKEVLDDIKKNGLKPAGSQGADTWAKQRGVNTETFFTDKNQSPHRQHSVFITPDPTVATQFAKIAAKVRHQTPVILEVHIPKQDAEDYLVADEGGDPTVATNFVRFEGVIKPEWIIGEVPLDDSVTKKFGVASMQTGKFTAAIENEAMEDYIRVFLILFPRRS